MAQTETKPNFQMIHIASEFVALVGLTLYFTSKYNSLNVEIKKLQSVVQQQHGKIQQMEKQMKEMFQNIQRMEMSVVKMQTPADPKLSDFHQFDDPTDVFAHMMGVPPFFQSEMAQQPSKNESGTRDIQIIDDDSQNSRKGPGAHVMNADDGMDTESQLDDQLADEFAELMPNVSATSGKNSTGAQQPPQPPPQQPPQQQPPQQQSQKQSNKNAGKTNKLLPIQQQQAVAIDFSNNGIIQNKFGKSDLNDKSPSNNSQLSIQDE